MIGNKFFFHKKFSYAESVTEFLAQLKTIHATDVHVTSYCYGDGNSYVRYTVFYCTDEENNKKLI